MEKFKSLTNNKEVEIISYVKSWLESHPESELYIGTDSQVRGAKTVFATVIVLHEARKGGHVLYSKCNILKMRDMSQRLWKEVEFSLEVAELLTSAGIKKPKYIDIDINPDEKWSSNMMLASALGLIKWKGFEGRSKPDAFCASHVADKLVKI